MTARFAKALAFFTMLCASLPVTAGDAAQLHIDVVYFSSPECPYCRDWEAVDLQRLKKSRLFERIRFTKITKAINSSVPATSSFPDEIKHLREPIAEKIEGSGSPMFAIVANGQVVSSWRGAKKYSPVQILKIIERQVRASSSLPQKPVVKIRSPGAKAAGRSGAIREIRVAATSSRGSGTSGLLPSVRRIGKLVAPDAGLECLTGKERSRMPREVLAMG
jgi:hypothetical protein